MGHGPGAGLSASTPVASPSFGARWREDRPLRGVGLAGVLPLVLALCGCPAAPSPRPSAPPLAARASFAGPEPDAHLVGGLVELVESVPLETSWDQPGLRETRQVWLEMLGRARRTVDVAQFYLADAPGEALEAVVAALQAAARRGVRLRVLVERKMLDQSRPTLERLARAPGARTAVYDLSAHTGGINHAKVLLIDGAEAFVGSQNMDWRALDHIHELGLRVRDPEVVRTLARIFETDWTLATTGALPAFARTGDRDRDGLPDAQDPRPDTPTWAPRASAEVPQLYLVASPPALTPPGVPAAAGRLVRLLDAARTSVHVQLLSYAVKGYSGKRWTVVDQALRRAAARGVRVRLNVADWSKAEPKLSALKALVRVPNVEVKLNTIPEHSSGFIPYARVDHCKYAVFDGRVGWIGTSNWSGDYFLSSRNVELVLRAPAVVGAMERIFAQGWDGPYAEALDPERDYEPPRRH